MAGVFLVLLAARRLRHWLDDDGPRVSNAGRGAGGYLLLRRAVGLAMATSGRTAIAAERSSPQSRGVVRGLRWHRCQPFGVPGNCSARVAGCGGFGSVSVTGCDGGKCTRPHRTHDEGFGEEHRGVCRSHDARTLSGFRDFSRQRIVRLFSTAAGGGRNWPGPAQSQRKAPLSPRTMMFLGIVISGIQVQADWSKAALMRANGEAAERLIGQLVEVVRDSADDADLYMLDVQGDMPHIPCTRSGVSPRLRTRGRCSGSWQPTGTWLFDLSYATSRRSLETLGGVVVAPVSPDRPIEGASASSHQSTEDSTAIFERARTVPGTIYNRRYNRTSVGCRILECVDDRVVVHTAPGSKPHARDPEQHDGAHQPEDSRSLSSEHRHVKPDVPRRARGPPCNRCRARCRASTTHLRRPIRDRASLGS